MAHIAERFKDLFRQYDASIVERLDDVYAPDVRFRDPAHEIEGLPALREYFARLSEGVEACRFDYGHELRTADSAAIEWTMHLRHPRLGGGRPVEVPGCTYLRFGDRVVLHHDYFDMGTLLYEHVPLLGSVVSAVKRRLAEGA